jgi:hypothetical protein
MKPLLHIQNLSGCGATVKMPPETALLIRGSCCSTAILCRAAQLELDCKL